VYIQTDRKQDAHVGVDADAQAKKASYVQTDEERDMQREESEVGTEECAGGRDLARRAKMGWIHKAG
jgi:hypothetical protein